MQVYNHNQWEGLTVGEIMDFYTLGLNKLYKESILKVSGMGYPKDPDFGDDIRPVDIYYNLL